MPRKVETFGVAMRAMHGWVDELTDERLIEGGVLAGTVALWAASLDDALAYRFTGPNGYRARRQAEGSAELMLGLTWARNAVTHGFAIVATARGLEWPLAYPIDYGPDVWREERTIAWDRGPRHARSDAAERTAYRTRFERRPLAEPLREVLEWLELWRGEAAL